jgi:dihydrofolate reductase
MKKIALIVAQAKNGAIGKNNDLLWHLPLDMAFFKNTTKEAIVLTGRKNYESIPEKYRPLPGRENWVISRDKNYDAKGAIVMNSITEALERYKNYETETPLFIIGGGQIYAEVQTLDCVDEMYITQVDTQIDGDTYFEVAQPEIWKIETIQKVLKDEKHAFDFEMKLYTRK